MVCSREFSHRIKSISMAKFTSAEVSALQAGGNEVILIILESVCTVKGGGVSQLVIPYCEVYERYT